MAVDPRLECLPEHEGPALRTWNIIMQTTMGKVIKPASFCFDPSKQNTFDKRSFKVGEDFISLNNSNANKKFDLYEAKSISGQDTKKSQQSDFTDDEDENNNIHNAPWKKCAKYPENANGLHQEIIDFYNYMAPMPEEEMMRNDVIQRITDLVVSIWPSAKIEVFGSFRTNIYLPTSDIDLVVFGKWEKLPLFTLEKALIQNDIADAATVKVLDKASVPIIKLTDKKTRVHVDISFNTDTAVQSAEMVKSYIKEFKVLPYLYLTLKYFLAQRELNEVFTGGISSYCLMLLTVSFLQLHPRIDVKKSNVNLGVLLMEFFELYGRNFNYQKVGIKIKNGGSYIDKDLLAKDLGNGECPALLCIEDPVTLGNDIGRSSYGILRVKEAFEYAFNILDSAFRNESYFTINPGSTYLSRIISVPKDLIVYRNWIHSVFRTEPYKPAVSVISPPSPIYQLSTVPIYSQNRPALLPTPPGQYSTQLKVSSPFSNLTTTASSIQYNSFYTNMYNSQHVVLPSNANSTMVYPIATMVPSTTSSRNISVTVHATNEQQINKITNLQKIEEISTPGQSINQTQLSYAKAASNIDLCRTSRSSPMTTYSRSTPVITSSPTYNRKNSTNSNSRNSSPSAASRSKNRQNKVFNDSLEKNNFENTDLNHIPQPLKAVVVSADNAWSRKRNDIISLSDSSDDACYSKKANFRLDVKQTAHIISSDEGD
ncbi:terminal nucleotidyltransferase 4A-like isoform X1 [Hydra vulgaris]|uniref:Terminal nucleotidyltransferase 4A-like isoform X1 n=1 Tax=Hydra vulgaris TaxID=6087 RepID=A0ABM4DQ74_HYDVU